MMTLPAIFAGTQLIVAVADGVPNFDVSQSCRAMASASASIGIKDDLGRCVADEKGIRDQLAKQWTSFAAADRTSCTFLSTIGGSPTYTHLITCLEMKRDARALPKDGTGTVGQGRR